MISGVLNIYKEKGYTSHDVVAILRGIFNQKKIGHTGTLDPDAEGLLPVCLGKATKICELLSDKDKVYDAVLLLGIKTDTQDITGEIIEEKPVDLGLDTKEIERVINSFIGKQNQIPPMYSALKINGRKLCDLAREGIEVERKPREITIYNIDIRKIELPEIDLTVHCSKGTYIRTLCQDIGEKLGFGGCMKELVRTKVNDFVIDEAVYLEEVRKYVYNNEIMNYIISVDKIFSNLPALTVKKEYNKALYNGAPIERDYLLKAEGGFAEGKFRIYDEIGSFIGIYSYDVVKETFKIDKMFYDV